jgi:2-polyprenyl-3-methyl-5-hydroxy-6-metoxy-1,4-benzoquinol methylase
MSRQMFFCCNVSNFVANCDALTSGCVVVSVMWRTVSSHFVANSIAAIVLRRRYESSHG